jgi:hypothetical protein
MKIFGCGQDLTELKNLGIHTIWGGRDLAKIESSHQNGMTWELACGAFGTTDERLFAVDVVGRATRWFASGCPNREEIRIPALARIEQLARTPGISGIVIDGARFASPASPEGATAFFSCFCPCCMAKAQSLGYDAERMKTAVALLYQAIFANGDLQLNTCRDGLRDWLQFRASCTTEFLRAFHETVKQANPALRTGIFIFAPTLASLVGQDYASLTFLDSFVPMIYRHYKQPKGPACLDHEYRAINRYIAQASPAARPILRELATEIGLQFPAEQDDGVFQPSAIERETALARRMIGDRELCPIILLDDDRLAESVAAARRGGADDVGFFAYKPEHLPFLQNVVKIRPPII